jgi:hypothetical protein
MRSTSSRIVLFRLPPFRTQGAGSDLADGRFVQRGFGAKTGRRRQRSFLDPVSSRFRIWRSRRVAHDTSQAIES